VLVDGNLMENCWGGFTQSGYGILVTPKNQHSGHKNVCPLCQVTDVTIRYVHVSHAGGGLQLATSISGNGRNGAAALSGKRWSIHDVVLDDLNPKYVGGGTAFEIVNGWGKNPLNTVTINHVTAFPYPNGHMMIIGDALKKPRMYGLVFTNNLVMTGEYPIWNADNKDSCARKDVPLTTLNRCFTRYTFSTNGLIASPSTFPPSKWPTKNMFPKTIPDVDFTSYQNGDGGDYQLLPRSAYKNKGTDGKDLGADIVRLNAELANVE
jgi:hypothetical protein